MSLLRSEAEQERQILQQVETSCQEVENNTLVVEDEAAWVLSQYSAVSSTVEQLQAQVNFASAIRSPSQPL